MADVSESLFQAIDTIVTKRIEAINFDNTDIYSIIDASKAEYGEYKVTDGSVVFTAYSTNTNYKKDEAVYVTIPNNDFNQQKLIIGKYTADSETPFIFTTPTSTMIDVTGNIIQGQIQEAGLTANSVNSQDRPEEEEVLMWQMDCQSKNFIGFERLGIKGDFKSWLSEFDCVEGNYGFKLRLQCIKNETYSNKTIYEIINNEIIKGVECNWDWIINSSGIVDEIKEVKNISSYAFNEFEAQRLTGKPSGLSWGEWADLLQYDVLSYSLARQKVIIQKYVQKKLNELYNYYDLYLDSKDMIGDVYGFVSYHRQEQVFDITDITQIISMELYFYQSPTTFKNILGEEIDHTDMFGYILARNLFAIDPYIMLGYDLEGFDGEQALLVTTDSLSYKQADNIDSITEEDDIYHQKVLHLSWLHEDSEGQIVNVENDTEIEGIYEIRWYQKSAGAASPDEWAGVEWKRLTQDGLGNDLARHQFTYTLLIDENSYNKPYEQIKAIVVYIPTVGTTKIVRSNIITFTNENDVINAATIDQTRGLSFNILDGSNGIYYIYRQDYNLIDENQQNVNRKIQCELYSEEFKLDGPLTEAKSITWRIPANNSMIYIDGFDYRGIGLKYTESDVIAMTEGATSLNDVSEEYKALIGTSKESYYYADIDYEVHKDDIINPLTNYLDANGNKASVGCKTTGLLYDVENKEIVITWYGNEDNAYSINSILEYRIKNAYTQNDTNNTITCVVNKNNRDYVGELELQFGIGGTNGTSYTLVIEAYNEGEGKIQKDFALTANTPNSKKLFFAHLYTTTPQAEKVDIYNNENFSKLKFEWKLGDSKEVTSYINNINNYSFAPSTDSSNITDNTNYNLKIGDIYYIDNTPDRIVLSYNANINDLLYLCLTVKGWGDYPLTTVFPIPIRSNTINYEDGSDGYTYQVSHINGPRTVCYSPEGYPDYTDNPYTLYIAEFEETTHLLSNNDIQVNSAIWKIYNPFDSLKAYSQEEKDNIKAKCDNAINNDGTFTADGDWLIENIYNVIFDNWTQQTHFVNSAVYDDEGRYLQNESIIKFRKTQIQAIKNLLKEDYYIASLSENNALEPVDFYIPNITGYGVQAFYGDNTVVWTQPIWVYQNDYGSTALNQWNGKELKIDESNGTIISRGIAAGKKESDNSFTGVIIGDWAASGDVNSSMASGTGVYGLEHGAMAYAFKDNGTAFIGKSGKGRILFDGNESTITSENYSNPNGGGVYIDLDDGYQRFANNKEQYAYFKIRNVTEFNNNKSELYTADANETVFTKVPNNATYNKDTRYFKLVSNYYVTINTRKTNLKYNNHALEIGLSGSSNFYVQWDGTLFATNAYIQGYIHGSTIDINNGDFYVNEKGLTFMNNFSANYGTIDDGNITALMKIKDGSILNGTLDATRGSIEQGSFYNPTIYGPNINLYFDATSYEQYNYNYVEVYNYDENISTYYLRKSDVYGSAGSSNSFISVTCTSSGVFDRQIELYGHIYIYQKTSTSSSSSGGAGQTSIKMYTGSGKANPGNYIGFFGMAGNSSDGYVAGINLTGAASGVNYGIAFYSSGGNVISTDTSGHVYLAARENKTTTTVSSLQLSSQSNESDVVIRGAKSKWALRFGKTNNDAPYINYNDSDTHYDLRYAYFA